MESTIHEDAYKHVPAFLDRWLKRCLHVSIQYVKMLTHVLLLFVSLGLSSEMIFLLIFDFYVRIQYPKYGSFYPWWFALIFVYITRGCLQPCFSSLQNSFRGLWTSLIRHFEPTLPKCIMFRFTLVHFTKTCISETDLFQRY